jgi:hypothetical protein
VDKLTSLTNSIEAATAAGQWEVARELTRALNALIAESKLDKSSLNIQSEDMTPAQTARRGRAIALGHAKGDPLKVAIGESKWRNGGRYARERHGISEGSWSNYTNGKSPVPASIDKATRKDFPEVFAAGWNWPKGVIE